MSDRYIFKDFPDSTKTDSEHPLLGPWSPRCSTAAKLRGEFIRPYILEALDVSGTTWRGGGLWGWYQVPLSSRAEAMLTAWVLDKRLHQSGEAHYSSQKTIFFMRRLWVWCGWFTAVMSYPLPPVLFFCFSFFGMLSQETLRFCHTSGLMMPYCHPGGARENRWYGVHGEIAACTLWNRTSQKRLKAFDQISYSKLLRIFCHNPPPQPKKFELIQGGTCMTKNEGNVRMLFYNLDREPHCFPLKYSIMRATRPHVYIVTHFGYLPVKTIMYKDRVTSSATIQRTLYICFTFI